MPVLTRSQLRAQMPSSEKEERYTNLCEHYKYAIKQLEPHDLYKIQQLVAASKHMSDAASHFAAANMLNIAAAAERTATAGDEAAKRIIDAVVPMPKHLMKPASEEM